MHIGYALVVAVTSVRYGRRLVVGVLGAVTVRACCRFGARDHTRAERKRLALTFDQLALIYKSLAVKSLRTLPAEDELCDDTIQLVDQALSDAIG